MSFSVATHFRAKDSVSPVFNTMTRSAHSFSAKVSNSFNTLANKVEKLEKKLNHTSKSFKKTGTSMSTNLTLPIAGGFGLAGKAAYDFENSMNGLRSVIFLSSKDIDKDISSLTNKAVELGNTTQFSATQAGEAMEFLGRAGWNSAQILANTGNVLNLAAASNMDLARSADIASNIMGAFGINAENTVKAGKVMDTLAAVTGTSNVNMEQLAETMKMSAPIASKFGASLEDTAAMTGLLGNIGIQGTVAGTSMKRAFLAFSTGSKELKSMGIRTMDIRGNMLPVVDILGQLGNKLNGLGSGKQLQVIEGIFGKIGMAGATELLKQAKSGELKQYIERLNSLDGSALAMAQARMRGMPGAIKYMNSALETAQISFSNDSGLTEAVISFSNAIKDVSNWLSATPKSFKQFLFGLGGILALSGPVIFGLGQIGFAMAGLAAGVRIIKSLEIAYNLWFLKTLLLEKAQLALNFVMNLNPAMKIAMAVIALGGAFYLAYKHSETFRKAVHWAWDGIKKFAQGVWGVFASIGGVIYNHLVYPMKTFLELMTHMPKVGGFAQSALNSIDDFEAKLSINPTDNIDKTVEHIRNTKSESTVDITLHSAEESLGIYPTAKTSPGVNLKLDGTLKQ